jgi:hypothetical protein
MNLGLLAASKQEVGAGFTSAAGIIGDPESREHRRESAYFSTFQRAGPHPVQIGIFLRTTYGVVQLIA